MLPPRLTRSSPLVDDVTAELSKVPEIRSVVSVVRKSPAVPVSSLIDWITGAPGKSLMTSVL